VTDDVNNCLVIIIATDDNNIAALQFEIKLFNFYHKFTQLTDFYGRKQLLLSAHLSHRNSVCPSVRLSVARVDQPKTVQARIIKSSPSAAWKTLVSGTGKLFHKFEEGHPERGR